jgi:hypothetical protein
MRTPHNKVLRTLKQLGGVRQTLEAARVRASSQAEQVWAAKLLADNQERTKIALWRMRSDLPG